MIRARINERLERAARFPVTLIVAPAGFGKSSALRDFLAASGLDAVQYDVRREDNTLLAFVHRLSEALESVAPTALAAFPSIQERVLAGAEPVRQLSDWFAEHLKGVSCTIVIDDLHYAAADPASIALLADLVERCSGRIRWIVAARSDAGLPIGTWIAYGRMDLPLGEDDLRFTTQEALNAAAANSAQLDAHEVESLRQLTEGWPVALTIALRTRTHSRDLRSASFGTREMIYRYLAEQVFAGLTPQEQRFALQTCAFSAFDMPMAAQFGASADFVRGVRSKIAFLNEVAPGEYRYHDLFRDFLEMELRRSGEREWAQAICRAAQILEARGNIAGALGLFTKVQSVPDIRRIAGAQGFALFEHGEIEVLAAAIDALPAGEQSEDAALLGIRGMLNASRGRFEAAEHDFISAIERSKEQELRLRLVYRYAIESVRRGRNCIAFLEPYALNASIPRMLRVPLLGTLATAYAADGQKSEAIDAITQALALCDSSIEDDVRARLYQQASYAFFAGDRYDDARTYAQSAAELAMSQNLYEVAARAYLNLYSVVYEQEDDPAKWLTILEKVAETARKGASNQARMFAAVESYAIGVERGDDPGEEQSPPPNELRTLYAQGFVRVMVPAQALREAWSGNFATAYDMLVRDLPASDSHERRALRSSQAALYGFAAGMTEQGEAAFAQAAHEIEAAERARRTVQAQTFLALADLVRGHSAGAHRWLSDAERRTTGQMKRLRAFIAAVRAAYRVQIAQAQPAELDEAVARLRAEDFGGMARLLEALPLQREQGHALASLTAAEREILQLLAGGASTKEVAARTRRSPHTVDTHIRSICRKLNCSGRREAVALATSQGWVHT